MEGPQFLTLAQAPAAVSAVLLSVVGLAVVSACGSSTNAGAANPPAPRGDLYQPPQPMTHRPAGTLIWAEKVPLPLNPSATVWRILYHSRSLSDQHVAVSGFAIVLTSAAPHGRRPVSAWARGTAGQADRCAPSHDLRRNLPPYGGELVARGAALVATDYQGLGTLGEPTYLARRLDIRSVVALAPGAHLTTILRSLGRLPFSDYLGATLWIADGFRAAYGARLDLSLMTTAARADLAHVAKECEAQTIARWRGRSVRAVFAHEPLSSPSLVKLLDENSPGGSDPHVPIFLRAGNLDKQIPVRVSAELEARYCRPGATVTRRVYARVDHNGVIDAASNDVLAWIRARVHGRPAPSSCPTRSAAKSEARASAMTSPR
jgi:hypothetical protein